VSERATLCFDRALRLARNKASPDEPGDFIPRKPAGARLARWREDNSDKFTMKALSVVVGYGCGQVLQLAS
jgi:hypothetical protein